ncbi:STAS domain-containing protein [Candidatus Venteria ishoeyi]|uniref:STAS domain protein n=1 Tax=Candidatus Venteria ishoeyi TaxID=1899563 RepID=A0A1H6F7G8_9GAMM|nr:STAS domain-containing protein [Candidatus Venteria ishoeyi]MDM8545945.1 STAS domain-containing protein [Candidatus Venteria ishoeyi]SEH06080.1 STAS domain protein [Candidatus Venteria ishoeyi]
MQIHIENLPNHSILHLSGHFTLPQIKKLKSELLEALLQQRVLELDLSAVADMDSAGFQLLVLLKREAKAHQKSLRLTGHSAAVLSVLDSYQVSAYFGDPQVLPKEVDIL